MDVKHLRRRRLSARTMGALGASGLVAAAGLALAAPASAAPSDMEFDCGGTTITVRVAESNSSEHGGWGAGRIVDGGSGILVPTSFWMSAYDETAGQYLVEPQTTAKGNGNANHRQEQISCTESFTATLGDILAQDGPPPGGLPDWADESDQVTLTFGVTAVQRG